jgi:LacI family transcriptional regulator
MVVSKERSRRPVTRTTVAKHAGVSTAVVSYVLNNGPRPVAAQTREKVLRSIAELGYRPNSVARALKIQRTLTFGLLVPDISNPYFAELSKAVEDVAFSRGYALLVANSSNDPARELSQLRALRARQADGLLVVRTSSAAPLIEEVANGPPMVLLDRADDNDDCPSVVADNFGGARAGVEHLISHGHKRIACIAGPSDVPAALDRERGWGAALKAARLSKRGGVLRTAFSRDGGYMAARELLTRADRPTAIFASSDQQGIGVLRACYELGLRVPEDVAVLAFDGTRQAEFTAPPLSVVRQDVMTIAELAIGILLDTPAEHPQHLTAPFTLIARHSCGC